MKNIEKNCFHGLKGQNKLLANTKYVKKIRLHFEKKKVCRGKFFIPLPPLPGK